MRPRDGRSPARELVQRQARALGDLIVVHPPAEAGCRLQFERRAPAPSP